MKTPPLTRREFLRRSGGLGFLAFSGAAPAFLARGAMHGAPAPERDRSILVLVQLAGGNDGLNTVIPHQDDRYFNLRPNLAIRDGHLALDDRLGLHPACGSLHRLFRDGRLAILQNVGYPNPNRSHFRSTEIWETGADGDAYRHTGWLGRYFDNTCSGAPGETDPCGVHVGDMMPQSFLSDEPHPVFGLRARGRVGGGKDPAEDAYEALLQAEHPDGNADYLRHTMMNTLVTERRVERHIGRYRPSANYPNSHLGQSLQRIAALIHADLETRVYFVSQSGYDTHANQANRHGRLLADLSDSLAAFQKDLAAQRHDDQVVTMTFSEFGRRPAENGSAGTDHGTAAPLFVMGRDVRGGILGDPPDLDVGPKEDLHHATDFRRIYATLLERWLATDSRKILGGAFESLDFLG